MRGLTPTEVDQYNGIREKYPNLNLPELSDEVTVEYVRQGICTFARVQVGGAFPSKMGWAVFSPIDRLRGVRKSIHRGEAIAFGRALKTPIWSPVPPVGSTGSVPF